MTTYAKDGFPASGPERSLLGKRFHPLEPPLDHTVLEFFAGIGLMRLGLERSGWRVIFANDIADEKRQMYAAHFGDKDFLVEDIHKLSPDAVPDATLATASFPCTDLSLAGGRAGLSGEQSSAFWGFTKILEGKGRFRPPLVLIENVTGFLTSHGGEDFRRALLELNRLGYGVDAFVVDAAWFVPQSRRRLFVVGALGESENEDCPPLPLATPLRPKALVDFMLAHDEICWNIRSLGSPSQGEKRLSDVLEELPQDHPAWWSEERATYLLGQMSPRHHKIADQMIAGQAWSYGTIFRRMRAGKSRAELRIDGLAGCLRVPKGGSAKQILFRAGFGRRAVRLLTPRECARLMGADDYAITVGGVQALFGFGDAVCADVVAWIAENYLNPLWVEKVRGSAPPAEDPARYEPARRFQSAG